MRCGGRTCRSTAVAAAASGGATTAPSAIAGAQGISGIRARVTTATAIVVRPTANDDEAGDRRPVVPEISRRRVVGGVEQHGRDEQRERELGRNGKGRRAWKKGEERTADRQEDGIGRADAPRRRGQDQGREDEAHESFEFTHAIADGAILARGASRCSAIDTATTTLSESLAGSMGMRTLV